MSSLNVFGWDSLWKHILFRYKDSLSRGDNWFYGSATVQKNTYAKECVILTECGRINDFRCQKLKKYEQWIIIAIIITRALLMHKMKHFLHVFQLNFFHKSGCLQLFLSMLCGSSFNVVTFLIYFHKNRSIVKGSQTRFYIKDRPLAPSTLLHRHFQRIPPVADLGDGSKY